MARPEETLLEVISLGPWWPASATVVLMRWRERGGLLSRSLWLCRRRRSLRGGRRRVGGRERFPWRLLVVPGCAGAQVENHSWSDRRRRGVVDRGWRRRQNVGAGVLGVVWRLGLSGGDSVDSVASSWGGGRRSSLLRDKRHSL